MLYITFNGNELLQIMKLLPNGEYGFYSKADAKKKEGKIGYTAVMRKKLERKLKKKNSQFATPFEHPARVNLQQNAAIGPVCMAAKYRQVTEIKKIHVSRPNVELLFLAWHHLSTQIKTDCEWKLLVQSALAAYMIRNNNLKLQQALSLQMIRSVRQTQLSYQENV